MPYSNNPEHLARMEQAYILKSVVWLDLVSNLQGSDSPISQNGRWTLYSFNDPVRSYLMGNESSVAGPPNPDLLGLNSDNPLNRVIFHIEYIAYSWKEYMVK